MRGVRPHASTLAVAILSTLVAAWLPHRLIERPLAKVVKRKLVESSVRLRAGEPGVS